MDINDIIRARAAVAQSLAAARSAMHEKKYSDAEAAATTASLLLAQLFIHVRGPLHHSKPRPIFIDTLVEQANVADELILIARREQGKEHLEGQHMPLKNLLEI